MKCIATTLSAALLMLAAMAPASAEIVRLEITSKQPYGTFRPGDYVLWKGRVHGELAPTEAIPDLDKAKRNERGKVEYASDVMLLMPADPAEGQRHAAGRCAQPRPRLRHRALQRPARRAVQLGQYPAGHRLSRRPRLCPGRGAVGARQRRRPAVLHRPRRQDALHRGRGLRDHARHRRFPGARLRPTPPARPIRCAARSTACWPAASRRAAGS